MTRDNVETLLASKDDASQIPSHTAIRLMKKFKLLYGPIRMNGIEVYLFPSLMQHHSFPTEQGEISLLVKICIVGLSIPKYVYHQLTVALMDSLNRLNEVNIIAEQIHPFGNGTSALMRIHKQNANDASEPIHVHLCHKPEDQLTLLRVEGSVATIKESWILLRIAKDLETELKKVWVAAQITFKVQCPICVLQKELNPHVITTPSLFISSTAVDAQHKKDNLPCLFGECESCLLKNLYTYI